MGKIADCTAYYPLVYALYRRHAAGCCLHVALDDENVDDHSIRHCLGVARGAAHADCEALAEVMLEMSVTQRRKLARAAHWPHGRKL
jgi:hypothetical protein